MKKAFNGYAGVMLSIKCEGFFCALFLFTLIFMLFISVEVQAGEMSDTTRSIVGMSKYALWGDATLEYTLSNGDSYRFRQDYNLNFKSYIYSPRVVHYTINAGYTAASGSDSAVSESDGFNYGLTAEIFPLLPVRLSLRAQIVDRRGFYYSDYGVTVGYSRRTKPVPITMWGRNVRNGNGNGKGLWYRDILPRAIILDFDRRTHRTVSSETLWHQVWLRARGGYKDTNYWLNLNYNDFSDLKNTKDNKSTFYGAELLTSTELKWKYFQSLQNSALFTESDNATSVRLYSALTGSYGKWNYGLRASYLYNSGALDQDRDQYNVDLSIARADRFKYLYKGWVLTFDWGLGFAYLPTAKKHDLSVTGSLYTSKQIGPYTQLYSATNAQVGTAGTSYNFSPGITHSQRILGWLNASAGYRLEVAGTSGFRFLQDNKNIEGTTKELFGEDRRTIVVHKANLGLDAVIRDVTLSSAASFYNSTPGTLLTWTNSAYYRTKLMRRINLTTGAQHSLSHTDINDETTTTNTYLLYATLEYSPWRKAWLTVNATLRRETPADFTTAELSSSLSWSWRSLLFNIDGYAARVFPDEGEGSTQWRITTRVTRSFEIRR